MEEQAPSRRPGVVTDADHRVLQRQARALGDPTRYEIFRYVAEASGPVGVAAITDRVGLSHNSVRQHLAKLCDAGLLLEEFAPPAGPGRPALRYRLAPGARSNWRTSGPYEELSLLLLDLVDGTRSPVEVGAAAARRANAGDPAPGDPLSALEATMARDALAPERIDHGDTVEFVLGRCPFEAAATMNREVVCELHRGLIEGTAETVAGGYEVMGFVAKEPGVGGCRLLLRRPARPEHGP